MLVCDVLGPTALITRYLHIRSSSFMTFDSRIRVQVWSDRLSELASSGKAIEQHFKFSLKASSRSRSQLFVSLSVPLYFLGKAGSNFDQRLKVCLILMATSRNVSWKNVIWLKMAWNNGCHIVFNSGLSLVSFYSVCVCVCVLPHAALQNWFWVCVENALNTCSCRKELYLYKR